MAKAPYTTDKTKPLFVVRINEEGYYSRNHYWQSVEIKKATWYNHKRANAVCGHARRLGYKNAQVEPLENVDANN